MVKQYAVLFSAPSTDWRACLTGDQASRLCCVVKRASSPKSTMRHLRTELSCRATDHGTESDVRTRGGKKKRKRKVTSGVFRLNYFIVFSCKRTAVTDTQPVFSLLDF